MLNPQFPRILRNTFVNALAQLAAPWNAVEARQLLAEFHTHHHSCPRLSRFARGRGGIARLIRHSNHLIKIVNPQHTASSRNCLVWPPFGERLRLVHQPFVSLTAQRWFAGIANQCDNTIMRKLLTLTATAVATGMIVLGYAHAQQTPPASAPQTPPASSAQTPGTTTTKPPAAKPGTAVAKKPPTVLTLKTQKEKASYAIGLNIGKSMHKDSVDVDPNIVLRGMKDGLAGNKPLLTDDEARATMVALQADLRKNQEAKMLVQGETNKKEGETFLAEN